MEEPKYMNQCSWAHQYMAGSVSYHRSPGQVLSLHGHCMCNPLPVVMLSLNGCCKLWWELSFKPEKGLARALWGLVLIFSRERWFWIPGASSCHARLDPSLHPHHIFSGDPKCHLSPLDKQDCMVGWLFPWMSTTALLKSMQPPVWGLPGQRAQGPTPPLPGRDFTPMQVCCFWESYLCVHQYKSKAGTKLSVCLLCWALVCSLLH